MSDEFEKDSDPIVLSNEDFDRFVELLDKEDENGNEKIQRLLEQERRWDKEHGFNEEK